MTHLFDTTKEDIIKMSWDEIQELMNRMIKHGFYDEFVKHLGKPPHVIKHDWFMDNMGDKKMDEEYDPLLWYKETLTRMTQEELDEEEAKRRMNGSWDNYVKTLGDTPENIIKKLGKVGE